MVNWRGWRKRSKNSSKKQEDYCQAQGSEEARETGPWSVAGQLSPLERGGPAEKVEEGSELG